MKNLVAKIISILALMLMLINSSLMLVISTAIDAVQSIIDESKINAIYELNLEKYVNYKVGDTPGLMVQANLKTGIEYQDGQEYVPIEATNVILNTPKVNEEYPERVEIVAKSTKATNGDENGKDFNYAYNKDNGEIKLITENKADENGNIYSENVADARDEYQVNLYYGSNCYNDKNEKRELEFSGKLNVALKKDDSEIIKSQDILQKLEVTENVSGLISTNVTTSDIYNGYIHSNAKNDTTYRTEYTENLNIQISYKEIADEVKINTKNLFVNNKDKEIETEDIVYKSSKINKDEILNELGEEGNLQFLDRDGNCLAEINKDSEADENGYVTVNYENELTELTLKMSKPEKIGEINVQNVKQIKESMKDTDVSKVETKNQISCINNVKKTEKVVDESTGESKDVETVKQVEFYNFENSNLTDIKDAKSDIELSVDNANWTNNVQNDVIFTATLVTNGPEYELFSNPVIQIKLPQEVEKVILGESYILYDNSIKLENVDVIDNKDFKVIRVKINGKQNSYIQNDVVNGVNVIIPASIILKKDITSMEEKVEYSCTNYNKTKSSETNNSELMINVTSIISNNENSDEEKDENTNITIQESHDTSKPVVQTKNIDLDKISIEYKAMLGNEELAEGASVHENEYIKYVAKVKNNTGDDIENLNVIASVPEGTTYVTVVTKPLTDEEKKTEKYDECTLTEITEQKEYSVDINLSKDEEKEIFFYVRANKTTEEITSVIKAKSGENEKEFKTLKNAINKAEIMVNLSGWETLRDVNIWRFVVTVTNNTNETLNNVEVDIYKNDKFTFSVKETDWKVVEEEGKWKLNIASIEPGETEDRVIYLNAKSSLGENDAVDMLASASVNGNIYYSNPNSQFIKNPNYKIVQTSDKEGEKLKYGETVEYIYTIENKTWLAWDFPLVLRDYLDSNMKPISAEYENYIVNQGEYEKKNCNVNLNVKYENEDEDVTGKFELYIPAGESITIKIKATPRMVFGQEEETTNYGVLAFDYNDTKFTIKSNTIKNTILPYDYEEPDPDKPDPDNPEPDKPDPDNPDPDNPDNPDPDNPSYNKYSISGVAWGDENQNGIREKSEKLLSGITVKLFNISTNEIVVKNNNKQIITTNQNGEYTFSDIEKGNYIVLFEYDTNKYKLTSYKNNNASESTNSDAINKTVNIDGTEKEVGITDIINISNQNVVHMDMGLIENGTYDLRLDKYITNVKVAYDSQTENYDYDNSKLAKVEIPAKKVDNAKITIEYKIEVKNEGDVDAIVESIADYKPDGLDFDRSLNQDWNIDNNILTNNAVMGSKLKPGETKSVVLYLTKTLSKDTMGNFTNSAEILKSSNLFDLKDIDSTEGNKDKNEDDYSEAQFIISVKTGIVLYAFIILGMLLLIAGIIAFIKTKNIKIDKMKGIKFSSLFVFTLTIILSTTTFAQECWFKEGPTESSPDGAWSIFESGGSSFGTYNYHHHEPEANKKLTGQINLYCSEGGKMARSDDKKYCFTASRVWDSDAEKYVYSGKKNKCESWHKSWTYEREAIKDDAPIYEDTEQVGNEASCTVGEKEEGKTKVIIGSDYVLVGPFRTQIVGVYNTKTFYNDTTKHGCAAWGIDSSGKTTRIVNSHYSDIDGNLLYPSNNTDFYLKIPNSENIQRVTAIQVGVYSDVTTTNKYSVMRHERWVEQLSHYNAQILKNNIELHYGDKDAPEACKKVNTKTTYADAQLELNIDIRGKLNIKKADKDTGDLLKGVKFTVTGPNEYKKENLYTDDKGEINLTGLLPGKYTVEETETIENYNLKLQDDEDKKITVEVTAGKTTTGTLYNRQYGSFYVIKHDKDTTVSSLGGEKLSGIGFKVFIMKGKEKKYLRNIDLKDDTVDKYCYDDFNINENKKDTAKTFVTGSDAKFTVKNLPVYYGKNKIKYYIEEYSLPENLKEFYDIKTDIDSIELLSNQNYAIVINNPQKYLQIAGYVWDDVANNNKGTLRNDLYESPETRVEGVTVNLKDKDGNIISTQKTNSNGEYRFKRVKIEELPNYYVEFEYNGLKYTNVKANFDKENGSKAIEKSDDRTGFNNSYATIKGGNSKNSSNTKGYTVDNSGNTKYNLMYKNGTYSSSLVQNTGYTVSSAANYVSAQGVFITASTRAANYSLDKWDKGVTEIANVNLGLYEREQPDLAISTDMSNIDMNINGYDHRYMGNIRSNYIKAGLPDVALNPGYSALLDGFNTSIKNNAGDYRDKTYSRGIYDAYIAYTKDNLNDEARLKVYVTYRIAIKNESTVAYVKAKSVRNYADTQLNFIDSYIEDGTNTDKKVTWKNVGKTGDSKRNIWESGEVDMYIEPGKIANVYLTYELNKDSISKLALLQPNGGNAYILSNTSEITSYSSYDSGKKAYAGIDKDSAPGNITFGDVDTYEDDTDSAPDINITRKPSKNIAGLVFEDEATLTLTKERIGDGRYDNGNNTVNDVQVDLIKFDGDNNHSNDSVIVLYSLGSDGQVIKKDASVKSSNGGKFEFDGIIPGEYAIKYTYGKKDSMQSKIANKDVTTQDYKSTIITNDKFKKAVQNNSEYWYEDTSLENYSSALDDWNLRTNINRNLKDITYSVKNNYDTNADDVNNHYMIASTGKMTFPIEETKGQTTNYGYREPSHTYNIKFGIVVRPKQMLTVKKEISYIKLTLQNGMVLVEGDPRTTKMNYVTYPQNGMLKIEVDNEIIQGSRIEVKYTISVTNNSEIDYNTESYYKYGTRGSNPISLRINSIVDYMDDALETYYNENSSDWKLKTGSDIKDSIAQNVYTTIKNKKNIFVNDWNTEIKPNETKSVDIEASKVLSSSEDNLYENYTEIIGASNDGGKFYGDETKNYTPGNFNFTDDTHESDDSFVKFTIVPSTGDNSIIYYIVGISCLIVIAGGVIIIKKFVL